MEQIKELINRRRRQVLVHSCIYYRLNSNVIPDNTYDMWCKELAELQKNNPEIAKECVYHEYYSDFDGSTGFNLPINLPEVVSKAYKLMRIHNERN